MSSLVLILVLLLPLLFILVLAEIACRVMRRMWNDYQAIPSREQNSMMLFFRGLGFVCSLGGLILGYYLGSRQATTAGCLAVAFCGIGAFFKGINGGVAGAFLGAFASVWGVSVMNSMRSR